MNKTILYAIIAGVIVQLIVHFVIKPVAEKKNISFIWNRDTGNM